MLAYLNFKEEAEAQSTDPILRRVRGTENKKNCRSNVQVHKFKHFVLSICTATVPYGSSTQNLVACVVEYKHQSPVRSSTSRSINLAPEAAEIRRARTKNSSPAKFLGELLVAIDSSNSVPSKNQHSFWSLLRLRRP